MSKTPLTLPDGFRFSVDDMTLGDLEDFEANYDGRSFFTVQRENAEDGLPMKAIVVLVWLALRKTNPAVTLTEVRNLPMSEMAKFEVPEEADPKES